MRTANSESLVFSARKAALGFLCAALSSVLLLVACSSSEKDTTGSIQEKACVVTDTANPPKFIQEFGCKADFDAMASVPLDTTIPGARSVKVVLDRIDTTYPNETYFQNSVKYKIHYDFASVNVNGVGPKGQSLPVITSLSDFSTTEYYKTTRRFVLGAITYYEGPKVWALELAPYDTASPEMIRALVLAGKGARLFRLRASLPPNLRLGHGHLEEAFVGGEGRYDRRNLCGH
ncbi:MAG: hypothetical protein QM756_39815 [Polyangiaceae bacterium]